MTQSVDPTRGRGDQGDGGEVETDSRRFAQTPEALLLDTDVSDGAVRLWGILDRVAQRDRIFPGRETLGERMGVSPATIDRRIMELRESGWCHVTRRGRGRTNLYRIFDKRHEPQPKAQQKRADSRAGKPFGSSHDDSQEIAGMTTLEIAQVRTLEIAGMTTEREQGDPEVVNEHSLVPAVAATPALPDAFEAFWDAWPKTRRVGKPKARAAFARSTKRVDPQRIIDAAAAHAAVWAGTEPRFIPHPTTWLNRDGWDDPLPAAAHSGPSLDFLDALDDDWRWKNPVTDTRMATSVDVIEVLEVDP